MKITIDGQEIHPSVARKVLHIQVECAGVLSEQTMDAIARDLAAGNTLAGRTS